MGKNEDLDSYIKLILQTNVMNHPANVSPSSRYKNTFKWRKIFSSFPPDQHEGDGFHFLPGGIKELEDKLTLLLGEYRAGNKTSTRNEIVAILDNLLSRKALSKEHYRAINTYILK